MLQQLLNLFYPLTCAGCQSILMQDETVLCIRCRHHIPLTEHHLNGDNEFIQKFYGRIALEFGGALFYFHKKGIVQEMIHKLKYQGQQNIGTTIGLWYASVLQDNTQIQSVDIIIPVPLHKKRMRERGYNQVSTFGKALSEQLQLPYTEEILVRNTYSKTQTKKNLLGRTAIASATFEVVNPEFYRGKHILLLDDVITTGATLEQCCTALLAIPDVKLSIACMAMAQG